MGGKFHPEAFKICFLTGERMTTKEIFYPTSIAVIGASSDEAKEKEGWVGRLLEFGYEGKIYPINPKGARILGLKSYPSVRDVAGTVDYAIFNVHASLVPNLLKECADKKVKVAHIFSSGFKETGKDEGVKLEQEVERIVRETDIRVIGPNCLGIHCPGGRVTFARFPKRSGPAALVSQTGAGASPHYADAFEIIAASPHIGLILTHLNPDAFVQWGGRPEWLHYSIDTLLNIFRKLPKPVALVLSPSETDEARDVVPEAWARCLDAGLAVFRSYEAAAKAISKLIQYHEFVRSVRGRVEE